MLKGEKQILEWSKLKNIIIIILLLLNLFLLLLVGGRAQQRIAAQEETKKSTISFLKKNGIQVEENMVPWDSKCTLQTTERDRKEEERLANLFLEVVKERKIGSAVEYSSERGMVRFYQDGRFSVFFNPEQGKQFQNIETQCVQYLEKLGLAVKLLETQQNGTSVKLSLIQKIEQYPVFNCEIEIECQDGRMISIQGWRIMGEPTPSADQQQGQTASTLLTHFMEAVMEGTIRCSEIRGITQGYLYSTGSLSSQEKLIPVWRIETDQGDVLLNCMTGKVETASVWLHQ
jgi:regulatory protein YycI of two-component signal transduction system YycFG